MSAPPPLPAPDPGTPPAPDAATDVYWLHRDGTSYGPYSTDELTRYLATGHASLDDQVCAVSGTRWTRLGDVEGFQPPPPPRPFFHHVAPWKFVLLHCATLGVYSLWFFWLSWRDEARRQAENMTSPPLMPFWRTVFAVLWFYPLCRAIQNRLGRPDPATAGMAAAAFLVLTVCRRLPDPWWALQFFSVVPALYPVLLTDRINRQAGMRGPHYSRIRWWQAPLITAGLFLLTLGALEWGGIIPTSQIVRGSELSRFHEAWLREQGLLREGDQPLFFYSSGFWWIRTDGNLVTDHEVVSYFEEEGQLIVNRAAFEEIRKVEVLDATSWPDDTSIRIWSQDADDEDGWFALVIAADNNLDDDVAAEIRRRIPESAERSTRPAESVAE